MERARPSTAPDNVSRNVSDFRVKNSSAVLMNQKVNWGGPITKQRYPMRFPIIGGKSRISQFGRPKGSSIIGEESDDTIHSMKPG